MIKDESVSAFRKLVGTMVDNAQEARSRSPDAPAPMAATGNSGPRLEIGFQRWGVHGDLYFGVGETADEMKPGMYRAVPLPNGGFGLMKQRVETDNLIRFPDTGTDDILEEFERFWTLEDKFRARGFLMKRGYLLWGPPGSGKTSCLQLMAKKLIDEHQGVVMLLDNPHWAASAFQMLRKIEPRRPVIAVMEDIDALVRQHGEQEYLALLDGEAQVDRITFVATTNYPERLDARFVDRPSRFDTLRFVGMPSAAARRLYLTTKEVSLGGDELEKWVNLSDGFSVAHLKEMIIANRCFDQPIEEVVRKLVEMQDIKPNSDQPPDKPTFGFTRQVRNNGHLVEAR